MMKGADAARLAQRANGGPYRGSVPVTPRHLAEPLLQMSELHLVASAVQQLQPDDGRHP